MTLSRVFGFLARLGLGTDSKQLKPQSSSIVFTSPLATVMSLERWTPVELNLRDEAFVTGMNKRDKGQCVVCGHGTMLGCDHAHIVPKVEGATWEDLRTRQFIPQGAKSVEHEARNGVLFCKRCVNLPALLLIPLESQHFSYFIIISKFADLQPFHGRAVRLFPSNRCLPFHSAFLIHEMRVRGFWPFAEDPTIPLPIQWQSWIHDVPNDNQGNGDDGDDHGGDDHDSDDHDGGDDDGNSDQKLRRHEAKRIPASGSYPMETLAADADPHPTITLTNPFANPAELDGLKRSFAEQPNFKALAESWKGTGEENIKKWQDLMGVRAEAK
ncbi:hypothetical protein BS47DRAFT_1352021 [Hydnum rufescens UP504]|uniref:HNH nuclease domain-containing protein n=1 Tax=Hydnum rufescens UP504 TaxID=1448309 RepID=A0A9P6AJV2_9AGAM|nr:hypothetical protein BS47DRAFT_1352021 [Hydnum rufescens UP504]